MFVFCYVKWIPGPQRVSLTENRRRGPQRRDQEKDVGGLPYRSVVPFRRFDGRLYCRFFLGRHPHYSEELAYQTVISVIDAAEMAVRDVGGAFRADAAVPFRHRLVPVQGNQQQRRQKNCRQHHRRYVPPLSHLSAKYMYSSLILKIPSSSLLALSCPIPFSPSYLPPISLPAVCSYVLLPPNNLPQVVSLSP